MKHTRIVAPADGIVGDFDLRPGSYLTAGNPLFALVEQQRPLDRRQLDISPGWLIWPGVMQGVGMGSIFVTLSTLAYATLPASATDAGAGLYNLARSVGSSIGVSVAATWYARFGQIDWNQLGGHINPFNPALAHWLKLQGLTLNDPMAAALLTHELSRQSAMLAFTQVFDLIALSFVLMAPLLLLLKPSGRRSGMSSEKQVT